MEASLVRTLVVSALLLAALVPLAPATAADHVVTANNFAWTPATLSIDVGESVQFVLGSGAHNWVSDFSSDSCSLPCVRSFATEGTFGYHCGFHPSMTGTIVVGAPPLVSITTPSAGETVSGVVRVEGAASHATSTIASVSVRIGEGDAVLATLSGAGGSVTWSADVPSTSAANGAQPVVAVATTSSGLAGQTSLLVDVDNPIVVDIVVSAMGAQPAATTSNTISFLLRNDGNAAATVQVLAEYLYQGEWRAIGSTSLAVGLSGSAAGSIAWKPALPHVGAFTVRVTADPAGVLPDPDRSNNERSARAGWFTSAAPGIVPTEPV